LSFDSLANATLNASIENGKAKIAQSGIVATDINASNGVIHVIDRVILPGDLSEKVSMNN
ncbi:MAG: fasciclin domain-containing protein, partial [Candidatus Omnitrophica bacterium]|nr:fasciclin domain-containing protein [Candidatus Omnitrophota bacterium]